MSETATILNVDDYQPSLYARSRLLERAGYRVLEAATGRQALNLVVERQPELVLLDVNLPDISGFDVCRQIKTNPAVSSTLVVHLSATSVASESRIAGLSGGADAYLTEPVEPGELLAQLDALLRVRSTEAELRRSHARLAEILEGIADGFFAVDGEWRVAEVNRAAIRTLFQRRMEDTTGQQVWGLCAGSDSAQFRGRCEAARASGLPQHFEAKLGPSDRWFDLHVYPRDGRIDVYLRDITDRKHAEEELARLYKEAETASRAKDEFIALTSHELRTPLNAIMGWLQILRSGRLDPDQAGRALDIITRNTAAQLRLIEDLLDVSRIVAGRTTIVKRPTDLRALAEMAVETIRPIAATEGIDVHFDGGAASAFVFADASRLQQVLDNILSNAVKFTHGGGSIYATLTTTDAGVQFTVRDTGEGIDSSFLPYVFDRFRQASETTGSPRAGLGLGLWIARYFVEAHGGTLSASSEGKGRGATFVVSLPLGVA